ncbi:Phox-like protein [Clavulina sp. PMI_390]|nr:Phox-like protein [Clavulina sp. PMI_390]
MQSIFIKETERRGAAPKTYVVYKITVSSGIRSWNVWHRYSEFTSLHDDLIQHTKSEPPAPLPPKHRLTLLTSPFGASSEEAIVEERRTGLETYLRAILSAKEPQWRDSFVFKDFLGIPAGQSEGGAGGASGSGGSTQFTSSAWLDEQADLQTLLRDVRADINKRDSLISTSSPLSSSTPPESDLITASHNANVQAKKKLAAALARLEPLTRGLQDLALAGMREGEVQRRADMVARLQDEANLLGKMVVAARQSGAAARLAGSGSGGPSASDSDRASLFGNAPSSSRAGSRPVTRVFGQKASPQETDQTRPLDDAGLVQLQQVQMDQQDAQLSQLTALLSRQKHLGLAISAEIEMQNEMLDQLSVDVDRAGDKLTAANKQMRKLK